MKKHPRFEPLTRKDGRTTMVRKKIIKVEVRFSNQVLVFKLPRIELFRLIDELIHKYEYDYFVDREAEADGHILRPTWRRDEIPNEAGLKILYYRTEQNLTQTALAQMAETTQANIASMEAGNRPIGKNMARRLGDALDVDYRVFL